MSLNIIYEDNFLLGIIKEPGMLSQSDSENDIISALPYRAHIINRLDRPVGGITLLAKDEDTAAKLTKQIVDKNTEKYYYAIVCSSCPHEGELTDYLMTNKRLNMAKVVNSGNTGAKLAMLSYKKLCERDGLSLIRVRLYTGRHHQIRAQLSAHNMPVWGDTKYNPLFRHKRGVLPALYACGLIFDHPVTGKILKLESKPRYGKFLDFTEDEYEL